ncbi:MAG: hypothetical protein LAO55_24155 [Acidobacteriia bacterium]|nr:hypothetical protein [Terriglobia bacterium]
MEMLEQHLWHELPPHTGSYAKISQKENVDTAVIFVHGWNGGADKTWYNFQGLVDSSERCEHWEKCDLFFFEYESVWNHIATSSGGLWDFLEGIYPEPKDDWFAANFAEIGIPELALEADLSALPCARHYTNLVLVGHSEGGVVIRKMLLDIIQTGVGMPKRAAAGRLAESQQDSSIEFAPSAPNPSLQFPATVELRLFAPALFGYRPSGGPGLVATSPGVGDLLHWSLNASPAYQDLKDPTKLLEPLQAETEKLAPENPMLRARITWAIDEHIVAIGPGRYTIDHQAKDAPGRTHSSVCKPTQHYLDPLEFCEL